MEGSDLKILMTTDTIGGVWTYSLQLCRALKGAGVRVYLISFGGNPSSDQLEAVKAIENVEFFPTSYKLEWMENPWDDVSKAKNYLEEIHRMYQPDIIHLNNFMDLSNLETPVVNVYHSCVLSWWEAVKGKSAPEQWERYRKLVSTSLKNADLVVGPTKAMIEKAKQIYGNELHAITIPNASNADLPEVEKEAFILCAGRVWDEAKNLKLLKEIAPEISMPIVVAGCNKHPDSNETLDLENITFLGQLPQPELLEWMSRAAIFFSPVLYEPFGLTILEAARSRCTLVLSDIDSLKENWAKAALFFDPKKPEQIIAAINKLIENPKYRNHLGDLAKNKSENFSVEKFGARYLEVYKSLLEVYHLLK